MKRKLLIGLLCFAVLFVPTLTNAAGSYIAKEDFTSSELVQLKSTTPSTDMATALAEVEKTVGNVHMIKYVSTNGFIVLTFSETGGFTQNTYNSMLNVLQHILSTTNYNHFVKNYPSISDKDASFTGFRVEHVPNDEWTNPESNAFGSTESLLRVEICSDEFEEITETPTPTPTPDTEVTNPSTGDMNVVILGTIVVIAVAGAYLSVCKIREN